MPGESLARHARWRVASSCLGCFDAETIDSVPVASRLHACIARGAAPVATGYMLYLPA
jgi:hypothetical protein